VTRRLRLSAATRALWLRILLTSYLVIGLILACMVTIFDHHGPERNPAHRHPTAGSESALRHQHQFELAHLHAGSPKHTHHGVAESVAADLGLSPIAGDGAPAFVDPDPLAAPGTAMPGSIGLPLLAGISAFLLMTRAVSPQRGMGSHQALFPPPPRPPSTLGR
jgi:hypothetical protein